MTQRSESKSAVRHHSNNIIYAKVHPKRAKENMSNTNSGSGSTSSGFRNTMGFLIMITLCTNFYIILLFHRSTAGRQLLSPSGNYEDANDPFAFEGRSPRSLLRQQQRDDEKFWRRQKKQQLNTNVQWGDNDDVGFTRENAGGERKRNKRRTNRFAPRWRRSRKVDQQQQNQQDDETDIDTTWEEGDEPDNRRWNQQQEHPQEYDNVQDIQEARAKLQKRLNKLNKQWNNKVWPKPDNWKTMDFYTIRLHFDCSEYAHDQTKPLPTVEDWNFFKNRYRNMVDRTKEFDDPVPGTQGYTLREEGGPPPYYAAHSTDGRGRGLFASRDIKKGELVHDGEQSDITFPSGMAWRRYVFSLPRNKACDVIDWTWTQQTPTSNGKYVIFSAMNISVLMNGAEEESEINVNAQDSTSSRMYATRDIQKDEEIITDYEMYDTVWEEVGLCDEACLQENDGE